MDEALILEKLDNLTNEVRSLKAGVLEELRNDLIPIVKKAGPVMTECLADLDEGHTREDLTHLIRNLLANVETMNSLLATIKGTMELKDEIEPVAKVALPTITDAFTTVDGQLNTDELVALLRNTLGNLHHFNSAITMLKAGMELKDEIEPIAKIVYPRAIEYCGEIAEGFDAEQLKVLMRNTLSNLENFNTAIGMFKAGMELKDEVEPIAKILLPNVIQLFNEIGDGFDADQLKPLMRNTLNNLENFNTGLNMLKAGMEFKDELEPLAKQMLPMVIEFFNEMEGFMKVGTTAMAALKSIKVSSAQSEAMSEVIRNIDLSKSNRVGPIAAVKKLTDPKVQEALGATFSMLEVVGAMLEAYRNNGSTK
jgi:hypothetical protein